MRDSVVACPQGWGGKRHLELSRSRLTSRRDQGNCCPDNTGAGKSKTELRRRTETESPSWHAPVSPPAPNAARSAADAATTPGPRARCPGGGPQPGSGRPGRAVGRARRGAAVAVIAARAGISAAAARQALLAHEKAGTATRSRAAAPTSPTPGCPPPRQLRRRGPRLGQHPRRRAARRRVGRRDPARPGSRWRHYRGPAGGRWR